jgi:hypothetical protein
MRRFFRGWVSWVVRRLKGPGVFGFDPYGRRRRLGLSRMLDAQGEADPQIQLLKKAIRAEWASDLSFRRRVWKRQVS